MLHAFFFYTPNCASVLSLENILKELRATASILPVTAVHRLWGHVSSGVCGMPRRGKSSILGGGLQDVMWSILFHQPRHGWAWIPCTTASSSQRDMGKNYFVVMELPCLPFWCLHWTNVPVHRGLHVARAQIGMSLCKDLSQPCYGAHGWDGSKM